MSNVREITNFLDKELMINEIPDYPFAENGLQISSRKLEINKVASAVDASLPVIKKAIDQGVNMLIVHHGLFWNGIQKLEGAVFEKFALAIENGLAIYSSHIPLDIHKEYGNNTLLSQAIGLQNVVPFHEWKGIDLGLKGTFEGTRDELSKKLQSVLGYEVHMCPGGDEEVGCVGVITGGAGSEVQTIRDEGIDTFITGEGPHWSYTLGEEIGLNVLYGGHYATEVFGVKAIGEKLAVQFELDHVFIDHPTGL